MKWWQCIQKQEKGLNLILILMLLLPTHQRLSLQQRITRLIFRQLICPRRLIWRIVQRNTPILLQRTSQPTIRLTTRQPTFLPSRQHTTTENRANGEEEATLEANREKVQNLDHGDQTCGDQVTLQQPILRLRFLPPLTFRRIIRPLICQPRSPRPACQHLLHIHPPIFLPICLHTTQPIQRTCPHSHPLIFFMERLPRATGTGAGIPVSWKQLMKCFRQLEKPATGRLGNWFQSLGNWDQKLGKLRQRLQNDSYRFRWKCWMELYMRLESLRAWWEFESWIMVVRALIPSWLQSWRGCSSDGEVCIILTQSKIDMLRSVTHRFQPLATCNLKEALTQQRLFCIGALYVISFSQIIKTLLSANSVF